VDDVLLKNPEDLTKGAAALPLAAIDDSTPEGAELLASARQILTNLARRRRRPSPPTIRRIPPLHAGPKAIFQAGTLYLDGRSCELCLRIDDIASTARWPA